MDRLRYVVGGVLPDHREWVRHDLVDPGWRWRIVRRVLLQALPFAVALALLPGSAGLRLALSAFLLLTSGFVAAAYAEQLRDRRLRQHGLYQSLHQNAGGPTTTGQS